MRYYMKSKFLKIKEDFWIKNEYDEEAYFVDNKFLTFGLQFDISKKDRVLYSVKEKLLTFMSNYEVLEHGNVVAQVNQKISFLKDRLNVSCKYGELNVKGDYFDYNYGIYQGIKLIAKVKKEMFSFTDNYYIDVDFEDEAFVLVLVVIIDNIIDKQKNNN
ncbi:MAG: hypothetical protein RR904_05780 [Bacilli bacterium]